MDAHFRAFSFVDRIASIHEGRQIRGSFTIPPGVDDFPPALVGEAVGQLAAWAAMAEVNFEVRPLAGLAGSVELFQAPRPGQVMELSADLEHVDTESVSYGGTARCDGKDLIHLRDCVGPMLPLADFDDPQAVRERFNSLCGSGVNPGGFEGLPRFSFERTDGEAGKWLSAVFRVPSEARFFADHFPRRAVFPGTLLMHLSLQLGATLAQEISPPAGGRWVGETIQNMKLRSFIPPGSSLSLGAKLKQHSPQAASLALETRMDEAVIATAGLALKLEEVV